MNVQYDSLNDVSFNEIILIFELVKSYTENYSINKKFRVQREFWNVNYICT